MVIILLETVENAGHGMMVANDAIGTHKMTEAKVIVILETSREALVLKEERSQTTLAMITKIDDEAQCHLEPNLTMSHKAVAMIGALARIVVLLVALIVIIILNHLRTVLIRVV